MVGKHLMPHFVINMMQTKSERFCLKETISLTVMESLMSDGTGMPALVFPC